MKIDARGLSSSLKCRTMGLFFTGKRKRDARHLQSEARKEYLVKNTVRNRFYSWLGRWNIVPGNRIEQIDVARNSFLESRASHKHAPDIVYDGSRGLAILNDSGDCELLYLPFAIPER